MKHDELIFTVMENKTDYDKYLKDLENELQCALPKLRKILEERGAMIGALEDTEYYLKMCKNNFERAGLTESVKYTNECINKIQNALSKAGDRYD